MKQVTSLAGKLGIIAGLIQTQVITETEKNVYLCWNLKVS